MTCPATTGRWRQCAGCGRERRLARDRDVLCDHNRWDQASGAMVACEGSGQEPVPAVPGRSPVRAGQAAGPDAAHRLARPWRGTA